MADEIKFYAAVQKVQTLVDGGIRVYLDLPEDAIITAAELMACKRHGTVLDFVATERKDEIVADCNDETEKDAEGGGPEMDSRRIAIRRNKRAGS